MHTPKASSPSAAAQGPALRLPQTAFSSCVPIPSRLDPTSPPGDLSPSQGHSEWRSGKFNGEKKSQRRKGEHRALSLHSALHRHAGTRSPLPAAGVVFESAAHIALGAPSSSSANSQGCTPLPFPAHPLPARSDHSLGATKR